MDHKQEGYPELIDIDWEALKFKPENPGEPKKGEGEGAVFMTSQEIMMSNEVEEYSDELRREQDDEMRGSVGKTSIAFFDIESMSTASKALVILGVICAFAGLAKFFHGELWEKEPPLNEQLKEARRLRKEKKKSQ